MGKGYWIDSAVVGAAAAAAGLEVVAVVGLEVVAVVGLMMVDGIAVGKEAIAVAELDMMVAAAGVAIELVVSVVLGTAVVLPAGRMLEEDENTFVVKVVVAVGNATTAGRPVHSLAETGVWEAVVEMGRISTERRDHPGLCTVAGRAAAHEEAVRMIRSARC